MITHIFSLPVYKYNIDKNCYNKKEIIKTIEDNYKKEKTRNNWEVDNSLKQSNLHHIHGDWDNKKFKEPNYKKIIPIYEKVISNFLNDLNLKRPVKFNFQIVNYTCMTSSQYMKYHYHPDCDFTAVHYIKFNTEKHHPTLYENSHSFAYFTKDLRPKLNDILDDKDSSNSWYHNSYFLKIEEDDICISPSFLFHSVPSQKETNETRITLVLNIKLE